MENMQALECSLRAFDIKYTKSVDKNNIVSLRFDSKEIFSFAIKTIGKEMVIRMQMSVAQNDGAFFLIYTLRGVK